MLGLAGVCIVCVSQILTLPKLDVCLQLSLGGFSLGLPVLTSAGLMQEALLDHPTVSSPAYWIAGSLLLLGPLCAMFGLASLLWHFGCVFAVIFLAGSAVGFAAILRLHHYVSTPSE